MRCLDRNKQAFSYALLNTDSTTLDKYGNPKVEYLAPVQMMANISPAMGESDIRPFGTDVQYDKVIITSDMSCPIDEHSVLFVDKEVEFTTSGTPIYDYIVKKVARSLNSISYAIAKVDVS